MKPNKRSNNKLTLPRPRTEIGRMTMKFRGKNVSIPGRMETWRML